MHFATIEWQLTKRFGIYFHLPVFYCISPRFFFSFDERMSNKMQRTHTHTQHNWCLNKNNIFFKLNAHSNYSMFSSVSKSAFIYETVDNCTINLSPHFHIFPLLYLFSYAKFDLSISNLHFSCKRRTKKIKIKQPKGNALTNSFLELYLQFR